MDRWQRLHKYADWKMGKFRLLHLPDDLFLSILTWLSETDVDNLATAVCGFPVDLAMKTHVDYLPQSMRASWTRCKVFKHFRHFLNSLADKALFHAFSVPHVCVFSDWSPFSSTFLPPVAEYFWSSDGRANVVVHETAMLHSVQEASRRKSCVLHISMYGLLTHPRIVVCPTTPFLASQYMFGPLHSTSDLETIS